MNIIEIIDKKRQKLAHTPEELAFLVEGAVSGEITDYQLAAWLMAVCCQGLSIEETTWLTDLYVRSGQKLDLSEVGGIVVDKHSTGGVGDKTTLVLAPLLAACGLKVAKLSGRGLGYTGGTIDKLEAIPGFQVNLSIEQFIRQVKTIGVALGCQTSELAPADGKIYALRDVTATVASIPLIAASVVSKKIAAGAQIITLDIKVGNGAFMKSADDAKTLAFTCREVGRSLGRSISTVISSMEQPLGNAIGHTVEVMEAIQTLQGKGPADLTELCLILGGVSLVDAGRVPDLESGKEMLREVIASGQALKKFAELIEAQHGDAGIIDDPALMPHPKFRVAVPSPRNGWVRDCDALRLAKAAKTLGAGRLTKEASIDVSVGVILHKKTGDSVQAGEPLAELWANNIGMDEAEALVLEAYRFSDSRVEAPALVDDIFLSRETPVDLVR